MRKPHGRMHRSFTPNGALPLQTISPRAAGAVARSLARLPDDSHRPGRSRRADAGGGRGTRTIGAIAACTWVGFAAPYPVWTLLAATRARGSWTILQVSGACAEGYLGTLPCNTTTCFRGAGRLLRDRHSRRNASRVPSRTNDGPSSRSFHSFWTGIPEFRTGTGVDPSVFH